MILGIGVDSIEISRVVKAMEKEHFVHRIFTEKERAEMEHAKRRGASDFAGKEAVVKAFGTGFAGIDACEVEILRRESGRPLCYTLWCGEKKSRRNGDYRLEDFYHKYKGSCDGICDCCGRRCKRIERRDFYERDVFR